jgi:hypothetical protein
MDGHAPGSAAAPPRGVLDRTSDHPLRWGDRLVALGLSLAYLVALLLTLDMGYTRDESYYFRYGQVYQDWFTEVLGADEAAAERALGRDAVVKTWIQNFEHPPLMKTLFGWSWYLFGEKVRPLAGVERLRSAEGEPTVTVRDLGLSEGFAVGATVLLLPPQAVGAERPAPALTGTVTQRQPRQATVRVAGDTAGRAAYAAACSGASGESAAVLRGCAALEDRPLALLTEGSATRFPALLFGAALVGLIYLLGTRFGGRWVGAFAALSYALIPRAFFHAHLAAFDVPVTTAIGLTLYAFWRAQWSRGWAVATAFAWGVALLTKHNAFFTAAFLVIYWLVAERRELGILRAPGAARGAGEGMAPGARRWPLWTAAAVLAVALTLLLGKGGLVLGLLAAPVLLGWRLRLPKLPLAFLLMPAIGLPMLFLLWPKLWFDPLQAVRDYLAFHLHHEHYLQHYFGAALEVPPFPVSYPFAMTFYTVPVLTLAAFFLGAGLVYGPALRDAATRLRDRVRGAGAGVVAAPPDEGALWRTRVRVFLAVNLLFPILLIAHPSTPIFGGVKHWLPAMPFFCILAGMGFDGLRRWLLRALVLPARAVAPVLGAVLLVVLLLPAVSETARVYPVGTAYYNELMGGPQGAAESRMQRLFWGHAQRHVLPWLNEHAPAGARVYFQNATHDAFVMYRRDGLLRQDIRYAWGSKEADLALYEHKKAFAELEFDIWRDLDVFGPSHQARIEGVPMVSVFVRPGVALRGGAGPLSDPAPGLPPE